MGFTGISFWNGLQGWEEASEVAGLWLENVPGRPRAQSAWLKGNCFASVGWSWELVLGWPLPCPASQLSS